MKLLPPPPSSSAVTKAMKSNKSKNTRPELIFRKELRKIGLDEYTLHPRNVIGRPDIAYPKKRVAIFVHGCFWHRCPKCKLTIPKTHTEYWREKFRRNIKRDKKNKTELRSSGWKVFEFWECDVKKDPFILAKSVRKYFRNYDNR